MGEHGILAYMNDKEPSTWDKAQAEIDTAREQFNQWQNEIKEGDEKTISMLAPKAVERMKKERPDLAKVMQRDLDSEDLEKRQQLANYYVAICIKTMDDAEDAHEKTQEILNNAMTVKALTDTWEYRVKDELSEDEASK
jgi:hypothetical protein